MRRVVITDMGVISPLGKDVDSFWNALTEGKSGIDTVTLVSPDDFRCKIAGEVKDFDPLQYMSKKDVRRMDRFSQLAVAAGVQVIEHSGINGEFYPPERVGMMIGSGIGGLGTIEKQHTTLMEKGPDRVSPFLIPMLLANMASALISMRYNFMGPNSCVVTACATSSHAIGDAYEVIRMEKADAMVCGGAEGAITPLAFAGFCSMKAMSTRNNDPQKASRPFDRNRDGFVMGEGAGIVILEELEHAKKRGAEIIAEIVGYGAAGDAHHMTSPPEDGRGEFLAIGACLKEAKVLAESVDYLNAHGTSTPTGDTSETIAIKRAFGNHAEKLRISSTKSMTGHLLGAAGGIELIASALALNHGVVPPTINYEEPDPQCDLNYTPNEAVEADLTYAMSASNGFGGHNACLLIRKFN